MRRLLLPLLVAVAACDPPLVPPDLPEPDAVADVGGHVLKTSGAPVMSGSVTIRCAEGRISGGAPIDAQGNYRALITASTEVLGSNTGSALCVFTAPGDIRVERTIGFGPPETPPALQIVDLRGEV
jgi:hypothetical protein